MNVLLLTYGTRGDVQPFVALGVELKERGHDVTLATSTRFEDFVRDHGLGFSALSDEMLAVLDTPEGKVIVESTRTILDSLRLNLRFARRIGPMLRRQAEDSWVAAQACAPDIVIFHPKGFAGPMLAEAFGCPAVLALTFPMMVPTGERPHLGFPSLPLGSAYNCMTHRLVNALATRAMKGPLKDSRRRHGLPPAKRHDVLHAADGRRLPSLTTISPSVVPEPGDWTSNDRMIGYWFLNDGNAVRLPDEVEAFLNGGPPPVYVGFGSMAGKAPERLGRLVVEALRRAGKRGILATGWGGLAGHETSDSILTVESVPHGALFPRVTAVVHHGGAGTTASGLRAGVPTVVVPFMGDQPFWGARVEALGVGPKAIPQKKLTVESLARAIGRATEDAGIRERSAALGERIRREDGVGETCRFVEGLGA
ncbi:MAG TPA: glycosyltransferase [Candidatus Krumholzibacteria bacterium]|nr:glycosyltransferase [Candidatus Krumholzibacteria bacterium]